jgi:hypothetical protein
VGSARLNPPALWQRRRFHFAPGTYWHHVIHAHRNFVMFARAGEHEWHGRAFDDDIGRTWVERWA